MWHGSDIVLLVVLVLVLLLFVFSPFLILFEVLLLLLIVLWSLECDDSECELSEISSLLVGR